MKKFLSTVAALLLSACAALSPAQQPQTQAAPIVDVNAKYVNGAAPGFWTVPSTGLSVSVSGGTAFCSGVVQQYGVSTLSLTANATNYVYLNTASNCVPAVRTSAFTASDIPIAVVSTNGSTVSSINDVRNQFVYNPSSGGGGATGPTNSIQTNIGGVSTGGANFTYTDAAGLTSGLQSQLNSHFNWGQFTSGGFTEYMASMDNNGNLSLGFPTNSSVFAPTAGGNLNIYGSLLQWYAQTQPGYDYGDGNVASPSTGWGAGPLFALEGVGYASGIMDALSIGDVPFGMNKPSPGDFNVLNMNWSWMGDSRAGSDEGVTGIRNNGTIDGLVYEATTSSIASNLGTGFQFTGTLSSNSAVVTSVSDTSHLVVGQYVFGTALPGWGVSSAPAKITAIDSTNHIVTLDQRASSAQTGITLTAGTPPNAHVTMQTTNNNGNYSVDRTLIDKTHDVNGVTIVGQASNYCPGNGECYENLVLSQAVATASNNGFLHAQTTGITPRNDSQTWTYVTFQIDGLTSAISSGDYCKINSNLPESFHALNVGSLSSGSQTIGAWIRHTHRAGEFVACGGWAGRYIEQQVDTNFWGNTTLNTTNGSVTATYISGQHLVVGFEVVGSGIPVGTFVSAVSGSNITLSNAATADGSGVEMSTGGTLRFLFYVAGALDTTHILVYGLQAGVVSTSLLGLGNDIVYHGSDITDVRDFPPSPKTTGFNLYLQDIDSTSFASGADVETPNGQFIFYAMEKGQLSDLNPFGQGSFGQKGCSGTGCGGYLAGQTINSFTNGEDPYNYNYHSFVTTGTVTSGSNLITGLASNAHILPGQSVTGSGIPSVTVILSSDATAHTAVMNQAATASSTETVTFQGRYNIDDYFQYTGAVHDVIHLTGLPAGSLLDINDSGELSTTALTSEHIFTASSGGFIQYLKNGTSGAISGWAPDARILDLSGAGATTGIILPGMTLGNTNVAPISMTLQTSISTSNAATSLVLGNTSIGTAVQATAPAEFDAGLGTALASSNGMLIRPTALTPVSAGQDLTPLSIQAYVQPGGFWDTVLRTQNESCPSGGGTSCTTQIRPGLSLVPNGGALTIGGATTINGALTVTGAFTFTGTPTFGAVTLSGNHNTNIALSPTASTDTVGITGPGFLGGQSIFFDGSASVIAINSRRPITGNAQTGANDSSFGFADSNPNYGVAIRPFELEAWVGGNNTGYQTMLYFEGTSAGTPGQFTGQTHLHLIPYSGAVDVGGSLAETGTGMFNVYGVMASNAWLPLTIYSAAGTPIPACASSNLGRLSTVSDATSPTYMGAYTSGGAITARVICSYNGTAYAWLTD